MFESKMPAFRPKMPVLVAVGGGVTFLFLMMYSWQGGGVVSNSEPCNCAKEKTKLEDKDTLYSQLLSTFLERLKDTKSPLISVNIQSQGGEAGLQVSGGAGAATHNQGVPPAPDPGVPPGVDKEVYKSFRRLLDDEEKEMIVSALTRLSQTCQENHFTYMMYSGTLLGSYRHHDMVPWDDDLDLFMNYTEKARIVAALKEHEPRYKVFVAGARVKFYSNKGIQTSSYSWKWPYIDISFFKENATHIWDGSMEDDYGDRKYVFPKQRVFPLHLRPLAGHFFYAPRDSFANLRGTYDLSNLMECATPYYSHKNEALAPAIIRKPCSALKSFVPFVHRSPDENGVRETLMLDGKIIHTLVVGEPKYAVSQPYKLELI